MPVANLAGLVRGVIAEALDQLPAQRSYPPDHYASAQVEFLQNRLAQTERTRHEATARAAALGAELDAAREHSSRLAGELDLARAATAQQVQLLAKLAETLDGDRAFAMKAIEEVRGETRAWKERCARAEALLKEEKLLLETFRQLAYQRGASIPRELQPEHAK